MKFLELVKRRQSIRKFSEQPVDREQIITCIEAARLAPSAENVQPWRFIVLDNRQSIEQFGNEAFSGVYRFSRWAMHAPVIIAIAVELDLLANRIGKEIQGTQYYLIDVGIAGEHIVLQAEELGLGSCWIGWFHARKGAKALGLLRGMKLAALIALGHPAEPRSKKKEKKPLEKILFFNRFER